MEPKFVQKTLRVRGMFCSGCEARIKNALESLEGVEAAEVSFSRSLLQVSYDPKALDLELIKELLEEQGYHGEDLPEGKKAPGDNGASITWLLGIGMIAFAVYSIVKNTIGFSFIPQINQNMGYGILFFVGLVTSLHCVAMCGGINLSQCIPQRAAPEKNRGLERLRPGLLYNSGRVISYTLLGGTAGALGSVISFSGGLKGSVIIISGILMFIVGLNMLGLVSWLRRINPRMPRLFGQKLYKGVGHRPFYVGLLNGLMPCGPLQAMQLYALGTGSFFAGALSMFIFSMGTVPLMFGLGALSTFLSSKFTHRLAKASAVLIMVLGLVMVSRGFNLMGFNTAFAFPESNANAAGTARFEGNVQEVTTILEAGRYSPIVVQKGIPVRWTIRAKASDLNGCNNPVTIPNYGVEKKLVPGDNIIEFTPLDEGNVTYTCWMGMIRSNIKVVADIDNPGPADTREVPGALPPAGTGVPSCCRQ